MIVFLFVFAAVSAVILAIHVALSAGIIANMAAEKGARGQPGAAPVIPWPGRPEVIVAVRDESATLPVLLESLRAQTRGDILFLFVDDRSRDRTGAILDEFCADIGGRARVIHAAREPVGLTGKQAALDLAFGSATGDILLFTDGDCIVPPTWAEEMLAHFYDPRVGVVLGRIELPEGSSFLQRFQAFEQPLLNQYNFGSVGIRMPTGCFGNNMAIRARAVREIGGFHALGYSVTEDAMLLDAVCRRGGWGVRTCTSDRGTASTRAQPSWKGFLDQHTRWNRRRAVLPGPRHADLVHVRRAHLPRGQPRRAAPGLPRLARAGPVAERVSQHRPARGPRGPVPGEEPAPLLRALPPVPLLLRFLLFVRHRAGTRPTPVRMERNNPQALSDSTSAVNASGPRTGTPVSSRSQLSCT